MRSESKQISESLSKVQGLYGADDVADLILCIAEEQDVFMTDKRLQCLLVITDCLFAEIFGFYCFNDVIERSSTPMLTSPYFIPAIYESYSGSGLNSLYRSTILNRRAAKEPEVLEQIFSKEALSFISSIVLRFGKLGEGAADLSVISSKLVEEQTKERTNKDEKIKYDN